MDTKVSQRQSPLPSTKPFKPRKFRSSCDACSVSKVKCDQSRPQCLRCTNSGVRCNYSPSRRMGKPSASTRKLATISKKSSASETSPSETEQQDTPPLSKRRQISSPSFIKDILPRESATEQNQCPFETSLIGTEDFMAMNWQDDLFQTSGFDDTPPADVQLTANPYDLNFDFIGASSKQLPNTQFTFDDDSSVDSTRASSRDPIYERYQHISSVSNSTNDPSRTSGPRLKLCTHSLDAFRTSPPSPYCRTEVSIDRVLINNKTAIANADALLACPCSDNPHFALTLALICMKILATYEDVIKVASTSCISPLSGQRNSGLPVPITVGAYKMDAEDEERMQVQIVINELRKVRSLVDRYAKKYCAGTKGDGGEGIYSALEAFLRSKLTTTMRDILNKLEL